ncbi:short-chain dehydrogenase [Colletotrichum scovillei]|uniref:Short-chain dehydrogenase n=1 Tax=Colletotrichum scovillei TaxID=1209932 RepID=A0A9P7RJX5_9PEZI|nr:short-chain dehydrogenase [Colletotrichum scovillei]KAG7077177.1 short-chain dehydrogenase [Colletotrichum scovillei]KAG7084291.1 short-chain dehydrogenase [Colletotrichum scovillei]
MSAIVSDIAGFAHHITPTDPQFKLSGLPLEVLARKVVLRLDDEPRHNAAGLLGLEQLSFVESRHERGVVLVGHVPGSCVADDLLHGCVNAAWAHGDAGDVGFLYCQVCREVVHGGLGSTVGSPRGVCASGCAG